MNRRTFIALLAGVITSPLVARGQQMPSIGVLVLGSPDPAPFLKALREGLRDLRYTEGQNFRLEIRSADGNPDLLPEKAAELVRLKVDLLVTFQTSPAMAAKRATSEIPIIMAGAGDPVGTGLVDSVASPGGNVTALSADTAEAAGKMVELIREVLPAARRLAVLANDGDAFAKPFLNQIGRATHALGMEMVPVTARPTGPLEPAFEVMAARRVDAVIIQASLLRNDIADLAMRHRLPSFATNRLVPLSGGLMSYAADIDRLYRDTAVYIDKILKGARPATLPVAFPTKFDLVINLKTAKALGLELPGSLVARADEVIE
jgi:putative ABC transport system substrate-binding protein